ncbi:MAG: hypothetical protein LBL23_02755 [Coriobacteriales bacterium]|jgi:hypothetical protein|nr:hypothetical protein [Coriobacteriales bacterium]
MYDSTKSVSQVSLRKKIVALLLAALMVVGLGIMALPATTAYGNTGNEAAWNIDGIDSCPQGGLFTFETSGFDASAGSVNVNLKDGLDVVLLGTFAVDGKTGELVPNGSPVSDRTAVLIPSSANPNVAAEIQFVYVGQVNPACSIYPFEVIENPYADEIVFNYVPSTPPYIAIHNIVSWGAEREIFMKIDYQEDPPYYTSFELGEDGLFTTIIDLPADYASDNHVITFLAPPATIDDVYWPPISVSFTTQAS